MVLRPKFNRSEQRGCLRRYQGGSQSAQRLICFPWAGAGASVYRRFAPFIPDTMELLAVQLPGREELYGKSRLLQMDHIVTYILDDLVSLFDRPVTFLGHSMGALIAYEVAYALQQRFDRKPRLLILSGSGSPHSKSSGLYKRCPATASDSELQEEISQMQGTPSELLDDQQVMRSLLPVLRADYAVLDHYRPLAPASFLASPMIVCGGQQDPTISVESLQAWRHYSAGDYQCHWFEGEHFYLSEQAQLMVKQILDWIAVSTEIRVATG